MTGDTMVNWDKCRLLSVIDDNEQMVQVTLGRFLIEVDDRADLTDVEDSVQRAVDSVPKYDRRTDQVFGAIAQLCESRGWAIRDCSDKEIECYG